MKYSIEPCHPLGFWGRHMEREVNSGGFSCPAAAMRFLELSTLAQLEDSIGQGALSVSRFLHGSDVEVAFLLDDLFASEELMTLVPPERVAEMIADTWERRAAGTDLPVACTVVSERSLTAAALEMMGCEAGNGGAALVVKRHQGIKIEVPTQAQNYVGEAVPSCPLLAAVWQMWRLGRAGSGNDRVQWWGDRHTAADRAFTTLNTSLMPVEVAAGAILGEHDIETLGLIGYLFLPDHW